MDPWSWPPNAAPPGWVREALRHPNGSAQMVWSTVLQPDQQRQWSELPQPLASMALASAAFMVPVWHDPRVFNDLQRFVQRAQAAIAATSTGTPPGHGMGPLAVDRGANAITRAGASSS